MDSRGSRTHIPDNKSADRRRLFDRLFEDDQTFSDPEMFYETTPKSGWHHRALFNNTDDWPGKRFQPTRTSSFVSQPGASPKGGFRSGFDDFGIPVRVMHETSPEKSWQKQKERHNSTGSSAATSSSTGSNDSNGHSTHRPRVFHIPIQVEPRDDLDSANTNRKSPPRRPSPEKEAFEPRKAERSPTQLSRSASFASEPPKISPRFAPPLSPRAQSVPTETLRRISPERKNRSPERPHGISRTKSMSHRPFEQQQPKIYHHPVKVDNIAMAPRRSNPQTVVEEVVYTEPIYAERAPNLHSFCTLPRVPVKKQIVKEKRPVHATNSAPDEQPQVYVTSSVPENKHHVTRIPVNVDIFPEKEVQPMKISADSIKQAMSDAAKRFKQTGDGPTGNAESQPQKEQSSRESSPVEVDHKTAIPVRWKEEERVREAPIDIEMKEVPEAPVQERQGPPKPKTKLDKIADIQKDVKLIKDTIKKFNGKIYEKDYLYLDESLTQNMLKLDVIDTDGKDEIRKARKTTVQEIQSCLSLLEVGINKSLNPTKSPENEQQEEGYCSMETEHLTNSESAPPMDCDSIPTIAEDTPELEHTKL